MAYVSMNDSMATDMYTSSSSSKGDSNDTKPATESGTTSTGSAKPEGFLKSMWHKLTDHPSPNEPPNDIGKDVKDKN